MTETGWKPSMFELWQQAGGDGDRYRALLREWGYVLRPGDEGYEDAPSSLPCGWPGKRLAGAGQPDPDRSLVADGVAALPPRCPFWRGMIGAVQAFRTGRSRG